MSGCANVRDTQNSKTCYWKNGAQDSHASPGSLGHMVIELLGIRGNCALGCSKPKIIIVGLGARSPNAGRRSGASILNGLLFWVLPRYMSMAFQFIRQEASVGLSLLSSFRCSTSDRILAAAQETPQRVDSAAVLPARKPALARRAHPESGRSDRWLANRRRSWR